MSATCRASGSACAASTDPPSARTAETASSSGVFVFAPRAASDQNAFEEKIAA